MRKSWLISLRLLLLGLLTAATAGSVAAVEPDKLLPAETEAVVTVNVKALLNSALVKKQALPQIRKGIEQNGQVGVLLRLLNFDPLKDLQSITVAVSKPREPVVLVIVHGRFNRDQVQAVLDQIARNEPKKLAVAEHGTVRIYQGKEGELPGYAAFLDLRTLVLSSSEAVVKKAIDQNRSRQGVRLTKELRAVLAKVDANQTAWLALAGSDGVKEWMRQSAEAQPIADKFDGAVVGVSVKEEILTEANLYTRDAETAKSMQADLEKGKQVLLKVADQLPDAGPILKEILNRALITAGGRTLQVRSEVSAETLAKLLKLAP